MSHKSLTHQLYPCLALVVADGLVFTLVDPMQAAAVWLIIGYALLAATVVAFVRLGNLAFRAYSPRSRQLARRFLYALATTAVVLVGLQSIGQLSTKDVATLLPFVVIGYIYSNYGKKVVADHA